MKKRYLAGVVALTAALAIGGGGAAFAAGAGTENPVTDAGVKEFADNKASTDINVMTDASQLKASVPLKVTVAAKVAGGDITAPTDGSYKILNKSQFKVYVTEMTGTAATDSTWAIVATDPSANLSPAGTIGDIFLTVNSKVLGTDTAPNFEVPAATVASGATEVTPGELALPLAGKTSPLKGVTPGTVAAATKALTIEYAISATAPTPATP